MSDHPHTQEDAFGSPPAPPRRRFYFDTNDGERLLEDEEGLELEGVEAARVQAQSALADMARDVVPGDGNQRTMTVRVRDEDGATILRASLVLTMETEQRRG